jgi:hypothetical protein
VIISFFQVPREAQSQTTAPLKMAPAVALEDVESNTMDFFSNSGLLLISNPYTGFSAHKKCGPILW